MMSSVACVFAPVCVYVCAGTNLKSFAGHTDAARADQSGSGSVAVLGCGGLLSGVMRSGHQLMMNH